MTLAARFRRAWIISASFLFCDFRKHFVVARRDLSGRFLAQSATPGHALISSRQAPVTNVHLYGVYIARWLRLGRWSVEAGRFQTYSTKPSPVERATSLIPDKCRYPSTQVNAGAAGVLKIAEILS